MGKWTGVTIPAFSDNGDRLRGIGVGLRRLL